MNESAGKNSKYGWEWGCGWKDHDGQGGGLEEIVEGYKVGSDTLFSNNEATAGDNQVQWREAKGSEVMVIVLGRSEGEGQWGLRHTYTVNQAGECTIVDEWLTEDMDKGVKAERQERSDLFLWMNVVNEGSERGRRRRRDGVEGDDVVWQFLAESRKGRKNEREEDEEKRGEKRKAGRGEEGGKGGK